MTTGKQVAAGAGIALLAAAATLSIRMAVLPDQPAPQQAASPRPTVSLSPKASPSPDELDKALDRVTVQAAPRPAPKPLAKAAVVPRETIAMPPCDNQPSLTGDVLRTGKSTWQVILIDPPTVFPCTLGPLKTTTPQYGPDASDVEVTITFTKRAQ